MRPPACWRCQNAPRTAAARYAALSGLCKGCAEEVERQANVANEELLAQIRERLPGDERA